MEKSTSFWTRNCNTRTSTLPRVAFTDFSDPRINDATKTLRFEKSLEPIIVAPNNAEALISSPDLFSPTHEEIIHFQEVLLNSQKTKNISEGVVAEQVRDSLYIGIAMLIDHKVDALVAGSLRPTADVVKASLQCIGAKDHRTLVAGHFFMESALLQTKNGTPFLLADCAVVPEPSARSLASIAIGAAESYAFFTGEKPIVAFLSFSTRGSASHPLVDRIKEAVTLTKKLAPDLQVDGELQGDAALDIDVARIKGAADSPVAGKANVLIFPTLEAGNIGYKLIQRFSKARVAGPILWGLKRPVSDLSRGCTVEEVTDTARTLCQMIGEIN